MMWYPPILAFVYSSQCNGNQRWFWNTSADLQQFCKRFPEKVLDKPDKTLMVWERRGRSQFCRKLFRMNHFKSKSELAFLKTKAMKKETVYNFDIIICRKPSCPPKCFCVVTCALLTKRMVKEGWILIKIEWRPINRHAQNRTRPKSSRLGRTSLANKGCIQGLCFGFREIFLVDASWCLGSFRRNETELKKLSIQKKVRNKRGFC